jgi:hypothetical protein
MYMMWWYVPYRTTVEVSDARFGSYLGSMKLSFLKLNPSLWIGVIWD